ncbi:unnamed protein product, partial [Effrenium voratum]
VGTGQFAAAGPHNLYVLGSVRDCHFRTGTRYGVDCSGVTIFGHSFELPLDFESPDEMLKLKVYHEPEYDDSEPLLLGSITVPLFALRRRRQICLQLPLKQEMTPLEGAW